MNNYVSVLDSVYYNEESSVMEETDTLVSFEAHFFQNGKSTYLLLIGMDSNIPIWPNKNNTKKIAPSFVGRAVFGNLSINVYVNTKRKNKIVKYYVSSFHFMKDKKRLQEIIHSYNDMCYDPYKVIYELFPNGNFRIIEKGHETPFLRSIIK